jgi:two-component system, OmpR family, response regulator ResD
MREPDAGHAGGQGKPETPRRVLLVDDEVSIREVVGQYLQLEGYDVMLAVDGLQALRLAESKPPDLVILDVMLPGIDGYEVCRRLRRASAVPILMLTALTGEEDQLTGFELGTDDYITKPFRPRELMMRVKAIMRRMDAMTLPAMLLDDAILFGGNIVVHSSLHQAERDGVSLGLTATEFDLLSFLVSHPKQVFSRQQLLDQVWHYDYVGDPDTVTVHMRRLREKIEPDPSNPRYLRTVRGIGYRFVP